MNPIEIYRKREKMTQAALAAKAGISRPKLSVIENGKGNPTKRTYDKLARALGCEVKDLM